MNTFKEFVKINNLPEEFLEIIKEKYDILIKDNYKNYKCNICNQDNLTHYDYIDGCGYICSNCVIY